MRRLIINGANGYVASNFINDLLALDNTEVIAFVRGNHKCSSDERMLNALSEINGENYTPPGNLKIYNYSLFDENFGLNDQQISDIFNQEVDYFHFAASLKYDLKSKDEIFQTNIDGLKNSLSIFQNNSQKGSRFFFISTAYSCGNIEGVFEEKFYDNAPIEKFRNYYEQSKRYAENIIRKELEKNPFDAHILRLSQVVGNNKTGVTLTDYGIFDFSKRIYNIAHRNPNQTVRVKVDPTATQNLIPIDTVTNYLGEIVKATELPLIMNLVAKQSLKNIHIIETLCKLLPINIVPVEQLEKSEMSVFERIISIGMSFTVNYVKTNIHFSTSNLDKYLPHIDNEVNPKSAFRMLNYFISNLSTKKTISGNKASKVPNQPELIKTKN